MADLVARWLVDGIYYENAEAAQKAEIETRRLRAIEKIFTDCGLPSNGANAIISSRTILMMRLEFLKALDGVPKEGGE